MTRWLAAIQAQELTVAKWSIGMRAEGVTETMVDEALARGTILRTHILRPTWHFVLASDIAWMLAATAPRVHARNAANYRDLELDDSTYAKMRRVLVRALEGGRHRTRKQLAAALQDAGITASGRRLAHLMMRAELDGIVCSGAPNGKQQTYALLEERAPASVRLPREESLAELTRRFFTSRGPATVRDYCSWSSLSAAEARQAIESIGPELEHMMVEDRAYWLAPSAAPTVGRATVVHLLQAYDEYLIPYRESKDVFNVEGLVAVVPGRATTFPHAVVRDGQVVGHWRRMAKGKVLVVEARLGRPLSGAEQRALGRATQRYGRFTGRPTTFAHAAPRTHHPSRTPS